MSGQACAVFIPCSAVQVLFSGTEWFLVAQSCGWGLWDAADRWASGSELDEPESGWQGGRCQPEASTGELPGLSAEEQHWGKVVLGSTKAGSEPVGPHAQGMTEGSAHFYLSLVFGRVSGLSFHHLFPLDPVL